MPYATTALQLGGHTVSRSCVWALGPGGSGAGRARSNPLSSGITLTFQKSEASYSKRLSKGDTAQSYLAYRPNYTWFGKASWYHMVKAERLIGQRATHSALHHSNSEVFYIASCQAQPRNRRRGHQTHVPTWSSML